MESIAFGLFCHPVATLLGFLYWFFLGQCQGNPWMPLASGCGGFIAGAICWRLFVHRTTQVPALAIAAGMLTSLFSPFFMWLLVGSARLLLALLPGGERFSWDEPHVWPFAVIAGAFVFSLGGLIFMATWLALPIGALLGWVFHRYLQGRLFAPLGRK